MMKPGAAFGKQQEGGDRKVDRWHKESEAAKLLKAGLESGDIDPHETPKSIWETYPIFQQYELHRFRAALNKMKAEMGCLMRKKPPGGGDLNEEDSKYGSTMNGECTGGGYINNVDDSVAEKGWMPINTIFEWTDSLIRERITILVVMPTGVGKSQYTVGVTSGGTKLEIRVQWPDMLCDVMKLHEPFNRLMEMKRGRDSGVVDAKTQDLMTRMQEFKKHIKVLERRMDNRMESKAVIELPRTVHAHDIETSPIGRNDDGARLLYINLLCECTDSTRERGADFFVI